MENLVTAMADRAFWNGKTVLLTGHTGFKGSWLMLWLSELGAKVHGLALPPDTTPSLFDQIGLADHPGHVIGDIRSASVLRERVQAVQPDVIFHLAAQPLVLRGYREPVETWDTNVMGTVHLLDALRDIDRKVAVLCITTDKVYENREWIYPYRETDPLGGHDPYSASKAACELAIDSFRRSYFPDGQVRVASARAGNVIGGGDWAENRIFPDIVRALARGETIDVRNPAAIRPWQHVMDPLAGYLCLAQALWDRDGLDQAFNFGPDVTSQQPVRAVVEAALSQWPGDWADLSDPDAPHEAGRLALAAEKAQLLLGWKPVWDFRTAITRTVEWYRAVHEGADPRQITLAQIDAFQAQVRA